MEKKIKKLLSKMNREYEQLQVDLHQKLEDYARKTTKAAIQKCDKIKSKYQRMIERSISNEKDNEVTKE